jgi:M6 family metalloprotease-like protein
MGKQLTLLLMLLFAAVSPLLSIIPHPLSSFEIDEREVVISEKFSPGPARTGSATLPQDVLVLMVEFSDVRFSETITNQDYLANPEHTVSDYVGRFMYHLQSYYLDASSEEYKINYTVLDSIITLSQIMAYYGEPTRSLERRIELAEEVIAIIDPVLDFSEYDAYIIMHSGAGRESDIYGTNPNTISSSFINRRLLQAVLDPENDEFPGLETGDNFFITEFIISATNHDHPDNPENLNYGSLGLLSHLFGRQMGLPTLFGNVSSMGRAAGAGNFCLMGTGVWNANGFVPPFLSAWTRYFAGWEEPEVIRTTREDLQVTYPFNPERSEIPKSYKILISDEEYYLLENRQQNPDGSTINGQPSFTFKLLEDGEQDYYDDFPDVPRFNFMKNSYRGCEWDFYLPGLGGPDFPEIDGSGILIWHIDENIIRENYDLNRINADPNHQGITLMEADGIQHLRSSQPDIYMRGSPYDSFRRGHNDYFGKMLTPEGSVSLPYVQSYYGEVELEIYNFSRAHNVMSFSVDYPWTLEYDYEGKDILPIAVVLTGDNNEYLLQTTRSGSIYLFKNQELLPDYPVVTDSIPQLYTYMEDLETFIIPVFVAGYGSAYYRLSGTETEISPAYSGYEWATHPVAVKNENPEARLITALHHPEQNRAVVLFYDRNFDLLNLSSFQNRKIASNMMLNDEELKFFIARDDNDSFQLQRISLEDYLLSTVYFEIPAGSVIKSAIAAPFTKDIQKSPLRDEQEEYAENILILTTDNRLYLFDDEGSVSSGFPVTLPEDILSYPSLGDINRNGYLEILLVSSNSLYVVGYNGELLNYPVPAELSYPVEESEALGVVSLDLTGDGNLEIIANLGGNRFAVWDNSFRLIPDYPLMLSSQPHNFPFPIFNEETVDFYLTAEDGVIYRRSFFVADNLNLPEDNWICEFGDLQRTASYTYPLPENTFTSESIFIKEHCYAFPVPVTYQNGGVLYLNIMVNQKLPVEVKIFDISGRRIFKEVRECQAYTNNRNKISLDINGLATGVYFILLQGGGDTVKLRFAVEK